MSDYTAFDLVADFYVRAPITFEMMRALAENPLAIAEGAAGAPRIAIDVGGQTAIATDETDVDLRLAPDGAGGVEWVDAVDSGSADFADTNASGTSMTEVVGSALTHGLWRIDAHAEGDDTTNGHHIAHGFCYVFNNAIIKQSSVNLFRSASAVGTSAISTSAFSLSGSGGSRAMNWSVSGWSAGTLTARMIGVRIA